MPETVKLKRPSAHRWVIGFLCIMTVAFISNLADAATGRTGESLRQIWRNLAFSSGGAFALFCLIVGGRHRWAYYVTSGVLGVWTLRKIYHLLLVAWLLAFGKKPLNVNIFHFDARDQPFYSQQLMSIVNHLALPASLALIGWMFFRFTFTRESRSYFQFRKRAVDIPGDLGKATKQHEQAQTPT